MNTDTETAAAPAATAELFRHDFNTAGVCESPEVVDVPHLPKHFTAQVRLALAEDGWRVGFEYEGPPVGVGMRGVLPDLSDTVFRERADALQAGCRRLIEALAGKSRARRAVEAIKAFLTAQGGEAAPDPVASDESLPANADEPPPAVPTLQVLTLGDLAVDGRNPRKAFDSDDLHELAESIERNGILQPLVVRKRRLLELEEDLVMGWRAHFVVVAGERRFRAARLLADRKVTVAIPCVVYETLSDQQALIIALTENLQRAGMNPIDEAEGFARLAQYGLTQQEIAATVHKSRPVIANALRLLELPDSVREILRSGQLTTAHGVALARFKAWPTIAARIADLAITKKTPAGDLEEGLPYSYNLEEEELVAEIHLWEFRDEFKLSAAAGEQGIPKVLSEQPWLLVDRSDEHASDPGLWAMDVPAFKQWMAQHRADQEAAEVAANPESKLAQFGTGPVIDLADLDYKEYKKVKDIPAAILKQIPADQIERGDYYSDKNVPIVRGLGLALANKLERAATIETNRTKREELDAAWVSALARIQSIDTIGAEHMSQLLGWACADHQIGSQTEVVTDVAEALGMELPKGIRTIELRNAEKLARFSPLALLRFILALRARAAWRVARRDASPLPDDLKLFASVEEAKPKPKKAPKAKKLKQAA